MVNLKKDSVSQEILKTYIQNHSDFIFELQTLEKINQVEIGQDSLNVSHGGLYSDHNTNKTRQYDFRVELIKEHFCLYLSIECKNIPDYYPILLEQTRCLEDESTYQYFENKYNLPAMLSNLTGINSKDGEFMKDSISNLFPKTGDFIGRNINQIGVKSGKEDNLYYEDSGVYDKWTQAIQSSLGSIDDKFNEILVRDQKLFFFIPCLVIPDGKLWIANYVGIDKNIEPTQASHAFYYVGKETDFYPNGNPFTKHFDFKINILHIVTLSGIEKFIQDLSMTLLENTPYSK